MFRASIHWRRYTCKLKFKKNNLFILVNLGSFLFPKKNWLDLQACLVAVPTMKHLVQMFLLLPIQNRIISIHHRSSKGNSLSKRFNAKKIITIFYSENEVRRKKKPPYFDISVRNGWILTVHMSDSFADLIDNFQYCVRIEWRAHAINQCASFA